MQALAERLEGVVGGRAITSVAPLQFSALKTVADPASLVGRTVEEIGRRGKFLVCRSAAATACSSTSRRAGASTWRSRPRRRRSRSSLLRLGFDDVALLLKEFGTERKRAGGCSHRETTGHGHARAQDRGVQGSAADVGGRPAGAHHPRDQRTVSGMGRGYTDDALHHAKVSPFASLRSLGPEERARLLDSIGAVLADGLAAERRRTGGLPTKVGDHWVVHKRAGSPCPTCGDPLKRVSYEATRSPLPQLPDGRQGARRPPPRGC